MNENYELLIFECRWEDIPKKENPAFKKSLFYEADRHNWFSIIICRVSEHQSTVCGDGYIVLDCSSNVPDVLHLGIFWKMFDAELFANTYMNRNNLSEIAKRCL